MIRPRQIEYTTKYRRIVLSPCCNGTWRIAIHQSGQRVLSYAMPTVRDALADIRRIIATDGNSMEYAVWR